METTTVSLNRSTSHLQNCVKTVGWYPGGMGDVSEAELERLLCPAKEFKSNGNTLIFAFNIIFKNMQ